MKEILKNNKYLENIARKIYLFIPYKQRKLDKYFYEFAALLKENEKSLLKKLKRINSKS